MMAQTVTIRMYEVGFGDCFLLGFHDADAGAGAEPRWVLIDCGTITEAKAQLTRVVDDILATAKGADGQTRLALVVATHRHKDHVWGFSDPRWADVPVGEVWMPWTEDPDDADATTIRERQSALALALAGTPRDDNPLELTPARETAAHAADRALDAIVLNALTNEAAMRTLHEGFAAPAPRRFLPERGSSMRARQLAALPGVTFHVLGPSRDKDVLSAMDPPEGEGYLRWPTRIPRRQAGPPFAERYCIRDTDFVPAAAGATFARADRVKVTRTVEEPTGFLGAALDRAVNNTSLVLMIEVGTRFLLFTGDAQWGSWKAMLDNPEARALLAHTTLLKVGHHGSHNATPRTLIDEVVSAPITALISVKPVKQWPNIPRQPLIDDLAAHRDLIARTDKELEATAPDFRVEPGLYIEWNG